MRFLKSWKSSVMKRLLKLRKTKNSVVKYRGAEFNVALDNYIEKNLLIHKSYEDKQIAYLLSVCEQENFDLFLDIGANFGLYSNIIALNTKIESIHAFEVDPRNYARLVGNIYMNSLLEKVISHSYALGDEEGEIQFHLATSISTGRSSVHNRETTPYEKVIKAQQRPLDSIIHDVNKKILIKMDVEGYEPFVIKGMKNLLDNNKCVIQIEVLENEEEGVELLEKLGFVKINQIGYDAYYKNFN